VRGDVDVSIFKKVPFRQKALPSYLGLKFGNSINFQIQIWENLENTGKNWNNLEKTGKIWKLL